MEKKFVIRIIIVAKNPFEASELERYPYIFTYRSFTVNGYTRLVKWTCVKSFDDFQYISKLPDELFSQLDILEKSLGSYTVSKSINIDIVSSMDVGVNIDDRLISSASAYCYKIGLQVFQ